MKILLIEDDYQVRNYVAKGLQEAGHTIDMAEEGKEGLFLATTEKYDLLILDHYLEKSDAIKAQKVIDISLLQHPTSTTLKLKKAHFLAATHKPNKALNILNN